MAAGGFGLTDGSSAGCGCVAVTDCNVDAERRNAAVAEELSSVALGGNAGLCGGDTAGFVSVLELLP